MTDRTDKERIMTLLRRAGLWAEADEYREQARQRLRAEGRTKPEAVETAWDAMAEKFLPLANAEQTSSLEVLGGEIDDILDSEYAETDARKRIRDSMFWVAEQFRRVVADGQTHTIVDFRKAKVRAPTALAIQLVETYAARKEKRTELVAKILAFADRSGAESRPFGSEESGGYLDSI